MAVDSQQIARDTEWISVNIGYQFLARKTGSKPSMLASCWSTNDRLLAHYKFVRWLFVCTRSRILETHRS